MKIKIGMKVRIKEDLEEFYKKQNQIEVNEDYAVTITEEMLRLAGETAIVTKVDNEDDTFKLDVLEHHWWESCFVDVIMPKQRGFEIVDDEFLKENGSAILPVRGDRRSAGYDFFIPVEVTIEPKSSKLVWTNIKAYMQEDEVLQLHVRSSIGIKKGLRLKNVTGIIDSSYYNSIDENGNIGICLYNPTNETITLKSGERVAQGIFQKYLVADNDTYLNETRTGGIGSTGVK